MARLERIRTPDDLEEVIGHFATALGAFEHEPPASEPEGLAPRRDDLRRAIGDWLFAVFKGMGGAADPGPPPPDLTLEDLRTMTLVERVAKWPEQWRREGELQGIVQGRREQLRSLAEVRFGASTARRLFVTLQREDDPQRLDEIATALVRCETGDELLRQASRTAPGGSAANPDA